jgi:phosphatidate cytidylyltransferase
MIQRIGYGTIAILLLLAVVMVDVGVARRLTGVPGMLPDLLRRGSILPILMALACVRGAMELNDLFRKADAQPFSRFAYVMIAFLVLAPWFSSAGWLGDNAADVEGLFWQFVGLLIATLGTGFLTVGRRRTDGASRNAALTLFLILYLGFAPSFATQIRCGRGFAGQDGAWLLFLTILLIKVSDIGGYFAGSWFGKRKLIPAISPGKTVEGTIGAILGCAAVAAALGALVLQVPQTESSMATTITRNGLSAAIQSLSKEMVQAFQSSLSSTSLPIMIASGSFGLLLAVAGQIGDLFESCFKRDAHVKDSAQLIPTFGGILDLIDSPVFAIPVAWLFLATIGRT